MASLSIKLLPATVEDAMDLGTVVYIANQHNRYAEILHAPPVTQEEQVEFYAESFRKGVAMGRTEVLGLNTVKAVAFDGEGRGIVVGLASWLLPSGDGEVGGEVGGEAEEKGEARQGEGEDGDANLPKWPAGINAARLIRDTDLEVKPFKDKFVGKGGAAIGSLAVHPEYQRKGIGELLVKWGLAKVDAAGQRTFVHSTEQGKRLYERCGFKEVAELVMDMSKYGRTGVIRTFCLLREVHGADIGPLFS